MSYLSDFEEINGGYVAFCGNPKGGKITGKGKTRTGKLDFDDVYFVKELKFNLFSALQMCDKKNSVLFTDTECIVLSSDFKLPDANHVLLRVPRENNMYNVDLKNIVPLGDLTCLFAKTTLDESNLWHRRLGHINFKTMNKLVLLEDYHQKFLKIIIHVLLVRKARNIKPLDETSPILKTFITGIENQLSLKVKIIKSDNGTEFKNKDLNQFCGMKGIKKEFSVPITPQQNGIAKRMNMTLIKTARTMLADSLLPIPFWAEAVNIACYVQNRVLVTKPHNKTPYELLLGRTPSIGFMIPFGYPITILNILDPLGKFDGKADEGFLVGYSVSSKAFRVFNSRARIIQETLHINFLENQPNVTGSGPTWLFDIDTLTKSMNYQPVLAANQPNSSAGIQEHFDAAKVGEGNVQQYMLFPLWSFGFKDPQNTNDDATFEVKGPEFKVKESEFEVKESESEVHVSPSSSAMTKKHNDKTQREAKGKSPVELSTGFRNLSEEFEDFSDNSFNEVNAASTSVPAVGQISTNSTNTFSAAGPSNTTVSPTLEKSSYVDPSQYPDDPNMPALEDITYSDDEEDVGTEADFFNLETSIPVSPIPTTRVHKDHHVTQIIGDLSSATQTRSMTRMVKDQGGPTQINNEDFHTCMFSCFLSKEEPKSVGDLSSATQTRSMTRMVKDQGHTQEEGIDYEEVFAPVARIEAIRLFLDYASFMGFMVYQMDVKSAFVYETIKEKVYVCQPLGFKDPDYPDKIYKVVKALYGLHQAPRAWYETLATYLLENSFHKGQTDQTLFIKKQKGNILLVQVYVDDIIFGSTNKELCKAFEKLMKDKFQMSSMGELTFFLGLQVKQKQDVIFISQDKYVAEILRKFSLTDRKSASTPIDTKKPLLKDPDGKDVDVHTYSDYAGASLDRKSTTGGCQFLGFRLISWQCKKQTVVATSSTEAEKKVIITEDTVCQALHLDDAESIDCLPNEEIFVELAKMGYGKPSTKLKFYKAFFSAQWKFLIHTFIQCMSAKRTAWNEFSSCMALAQVADDVAADDIVDVATTDVANENADVVAEDVAEPTPPSPTLAITPPQSQELHSTSQDDEPEPSELKEVIEVVTTAKLMTKVVTAAATTITAAPNATRRRKGVVIKDPEETMTPSTIVHSEPKSKDKGKGILVEEPKPLKKQAQIEQDEAYARELEAELNKNIN
nr:putative ribonuclease H-like domain-containing protein [Tanacetum cinerariifolium]